MSASDPLQAHHHARNQNNPYVLHIAAENSALPGAKEGGIADVVGNAARALVEVGCRVATLLPSHGFLHQLPGAREMCKVYFEFRGQPHRAELFDVGRVHPDSGVQHFVLHHPWLDAWDPERSRHRIYVHDGSDQPFFSDSSRFACFSAAAAAAVAQGLLGVPDVLHLHDWHTALVALLRRSDPACAPLTGMHTVFSIHNLGLQGIRPLRGNWSSLEAWFPRLSYHWLDVADPNISDCLNLMAVGMRLADRVHTVSPGYAEEIRQPSRKPHFFGAEGLESVVAYVHDSGRLIGILNGCEYPERTPTTPAASQAWPRIIQRAILEWSAGYSHLPSGHFVAYQRLEALLRQPTQIQTLLTSVGRITDQKVLLLRHPGSDGRSALERILDSLGESGLWIMLGSGDPEYENYFTRTAARRENLIFLNGYSEVCADALYRHAQLFIMPSSYEPCGISQMLAMREGCPCVVHGVGGLRDTVRDQHNGFVFEGRTATEQVDHFVARTIAAIEFQRRGGAPWHTLRRRAAKARFCWENAARNYCRQLYQRG